MTGGSTSSRIMKRILKCMSFDDPVPLPRLAEKIGMSESNLRRAMNDMEEVGLVAKEVLPHPKKTDMRKINTKPCLYGWRRTKLS